MAQPRFSSQSFAKLMAWLVIASFVLPLFVAVVPSTANAAEKAFFEDLAAGNSTCLHMGPGNGTGNEELPAQDGMPCCILCAAGAQPSMPVQVISPIVGLAPVWRTAPHRTVDNFLLSRLSLEATKPITSRGPPT